MRNPEVGKKADAAGVSLGRDLRPSQYLRRPVVKANEA
jgi:hypothetical protein